jgi:hypothetical protein
VALQTDDGRIHVFGHSGHDAGYGELDEAVFHDAFRLSAQAPPPPPPAEPDVDRPKPARRVATTLRAAVRLDGRTVTVSGRLQRESRAGALRGPIVLRFSSRGREHRVRVPAAVRWRRTVRLPAPGRWTLRIRYAGAGRYAAATMAPAVLDLR